MTKVLSALLVLGAATVAYAGGDLGWVYNRAGGKIILESDWCAAETPMLKVRSTGGPTTLTGCWTSLNGTHVIVIWDDRTTTVIPAENIILTPVGERIRAESRGDK